MFGFKKAIQRSFPEGEFDFFAEKDESVNSDVIEATKDESQIFFRLFPRGYGLLSNGIFPEGEGIADPSQSFEIRIEIGERVGGLQRLETDEVPLLNSSAVLLVPRWVCHKSPYLERGLSGEEGKFLTPMSPNELRIVLDGKNNFLTIESFAVIIDILVGWTDIQTAGFHSTLLFSIFGMAQLLELEHIQDAAKEILLTRVDIPTVAISAWLAKTYNRYHILNKCYWFLKNLFMSKTYPSDWQVDTGPEKGGWMSIGRKVEEKEEVPPDVVIKNGSIYYKSLEMPFSAFQAEVDENVREKKKYATATEGYTLCRIRRHRLGGDPPVEDNSSDDPNNEVERKISTEEESDSPSAFQKAFQKTVDWPHMYELAADEHTDVPILVAIKYAENQPFFIYAPPWPEEEQPKESTNGHDEEYEQQDYEQSQNAQVGGSSSSQLTQKEKLAIMRKNIPKLNQYAKEFVGVAEPNFWGTQFILYDEGADQNIVNASPAVQANNFPYRERKNVLTVSFEANLLGDTPRQVKLELNPEVRKSDVEGKGFGAKTPQYKMKSVKPVWDDKTQAYSLPFFGRAKKASAKNFQLAAGGKESSDVFLSFGKMTNEEFSLDFRHPITKRDAFAIALSSLAKKRAVA